ncbi:MAG: LemA family protein [Burkholderiaceae bacterium]
MVWWWLPPAALVAYGVWIFNRLIADRNLVAQGYADIDVQLKRRADLVPRLVEVVRASAAYERSALEAVVTLRAQASRQAARDGARGTHAERLQAEAQLGQALSRLLLLQEDYPQLKADADFRDLAARLVEIEDHLQFARRFYNGAVKQYVTRLQTFPDLIVGRLFAFKPAAFFETDERGPVQVRL